MLAGEVEGSADDRWPVEVGLRSSVRSADMGSSCSEDMRGYPPTLTADGTTPSTEVAVRTAVLESTDRYCSVRRSSSCTDSARVEMSKVWWRRRLSSCSR